MPLRPDETAGQWHARALREAHAASDAFDLLRTRPSKLGQVLLAGAIGSEDGALDASRDRLDAARIDLLDAFAELRKSGGNLLGDQPPLSAVRTG